MKRFVTQLWMAIVLTFIPLSSVQAASFWKLDMSDVADTVQTTDFLIEYTILVAGDNDTFTAQLYENNEIKSQQSVRAGGDSGTFRVTVPGNGTYQYFIRAIRTSDSDTKQTPTQTVTVRQPQGTINTVFIRDEGTATPGVSGGGTTTTAATTNTAQDGVTDGTDTTADGGTTATEGEEDGGDGEVSSLTTEDTQNQADDEDGNVLGAQDAVKDDGMSTASIVAGGAGIAALLAAAYYFLYYRRSKIE